MSSLENISAGVQFPAGTRGFSLLHSFHTGSGAQQAYYPMGTSGYSPGRIAAGA
jgi:hypothetical protein